MKAKIKVVIVIGVICTCFLQTSCKKFLAERPDKSLVVPTSIKDLQALLDNQNIITDSYSSVGEVAADNYYLTNADWLSITQEGNRNAYIWENEIIFDQIPNPWSRLYQIAYYANVCLEGIDDLAKSTTNEMEWDYLKGSALFFRARSFHSLAINWAKAYNSGSSATDLGIPLRLDSDINAEIIRSNLKDTYHRIEQDLLAAIPLLPVSPTHVIRPSKPAAYALLSRVYLSMRDYTKAGIYADSCLQLRNTLINFNTLNAAATYPIPAFNGEVVMHYLTAVPANLANTRSKIDSLLYQSYTVNDLRKTVFFRSNGNGSFGFKGSYNGSIVLFVGLATDEVLLTRAECFARSGNLTAAATDINTLLRSRWKTGTYTNATFSTSAEALAFILTERRKELVMRDLRWMDLKRLNAEGANITIKRVVNGTTYELKPNDLRYALPIPQYVIEQSGIPQNPR